MQSPLADAASRSYALAMSWKQKELTSQVSADPDGEVTINVFSVKSNRACLTWLYWHQ